VSAELARAGGPIACAGIAAFLVLRRRDFRLLALGAWAVGLALMLPYLAPSGHHRVLAAAAVVGLAGAVLLAWLFHRWPWLVAVATLACVPARIPVHVGHTQANLLVPLYGVVVAAALALAYELVRGDRRSRELGPLTWPLAGLVAWTGLSLLWSGDLHEGSVSLFFFWAPFALLAVSIARLSWTRRWLTLLLVQLVAMAVVFALIGVEQWATRDVFWNPKVIVDNAYAPFYRVNSVFYDPSIYGRFLVVAMVAALVVVMYSAGRRAPWAAAAAIVVTWVGLLFSFSQSSFGALIVGAVVVLAFRWKWRAAIALVAVSAMVAAVALATPHIRHSLLQKSGVGLNEATSGRASLIGTGIRIALAHPVEGVGVGAFKRAYANREGLRGREPKKAASHNTPVTVAAETGLPGLLLLGWLFFAALYLTLRRASTSFRGRACLAVAACLSAIGLHSLFYAALFEDPTFWALLGLTALASAIPERRPIPVAAAQPPVPSPDKEPVRA
jgi:O-antigen ligase